MSLTLVYTFAAFAAAADPATFDSFFQEFAAKRNGVKTLEAKFSQQSLTAEDSAAAQGTIVYTKPRRLIFRYEAPEPTYLIDSGRVYEYAPDIEQAQIYELDKNARSEAFFLGFDDDTSRLREAYDIEIFDPEGDPTGSKAIRLHPKPVEGEEPLFEQVTLYLRAQDYLPYRIHLINDAESQVKIFVSDYAVNTELKPDQTELVLPPGTTLIANDEVVEKVGEKGRRLPSEAPASTAAPSATIEVVPLPPPDAAPAAKPVPEAKP